jgi:hypothetical protein
VPVFRSAGLTGEQPARAALQEFGDADTVVAGFVAASPAKRTSRLLLAAGLPPALLALAACVSGCRIIATLHSLPAMMSAAV